MKFQIPNAKLQINSNNQIPIGSLTSKLAIYVELRISEIRLICVISGLRIGI